MRRESKQVLNSLIAIYISHYSIGNLLKSQDSNSDNNSEGSSDNSNNNNNNSKIESKFDDRPI